MADSMRDETQVPDAWRVVRLDDVAEINRSTWNPAKSSTILYLDLTSVLAPGVLAPPRSLSATDAPSRARRRVGSGDILVSTVRPNLRGFARVPEAPEDLVASTGFAVVSPGSYVSGSFIYHHVMSGQFAQYLENATTGQAYPAVLAGDVAGFRLPLPPLSEQLAIAAVLDSIDEAIERTEAVIATTERLRDALLHEVLTRGVPGWHSEWKEAPGIGTIPACWDVVRLGEVAEVASIQADPREKRFQRDLFVAPDDIESGTGRLTSRRTVADAAAISGKYQFRRGDILYSKIRPYLMKVYIPRELGLCSADIYPLRPSAALEPSYLAAVLLTPQFTAYTRTCSDRTGIPKVNRVDLFKYSLSLPPLAEQRAIAAVLDGVDEAIAHGRSETDVLRSLKACAADALLTGRVRVRDED